MRQHMAVAMAAVLMMAVGCHKDEPPAQAPVRTTPAEPAARLDQGNESRGTPMAQGEARKIFAQRCTLCHGLDGRGKGPAAATLSPRPRDYTDRAWQDSVSDEQLGRTILEGGAAVGKSMMMPPNPDLQDKPDVIVELVRIIRGFKK